MPSSNLSLPPGAAVGVIMNDPAIIAALTQGRRASSDSADAANGSAGSKSSSPYPRNLPPRFKRMAQSAGLVPASSSSTPPPALGASALERPLERPQAAATPPPGSGFQSNASSVPPRRRTQLNGGAGGSSASLLGMPNLTPDMPATLVVAADRVLLEGHPLVVQDAAVTASQQDKQASGPRISGPSVQHQVPSMHAQPFVPASMRAQLQAGQLPLLPPGITFPTVVFPVPVPVPIVPIPMRPIPHPATVTGAPLMQSTGSLAAMSALPLRNGSPNGMPDSNKSTADSYGDSSASSSALALAPPGASGNAEQQRMNLENAHRWGQLIARKTDVSPAATKTSPLVDFEDISKFKLVPVAPTPIDQATLVGRLSANATAAGEGTEQLEGTSSGTTTPTAGDLISSLFGVPDDSLPAAPSTTSSNMTSTAPIAAVSAPVPQSNSGTSVLRSSDKVNASSHFSGFHSFDTWKTFEPRTSAQTTAESSKPSNGSGVFSNGGANSNSKNSTTTSANALGIGTTSMSSSSWRLNPDVEPFQFHGSLQKPGGPAMPSIAGSADAPDLNSILGSIIDSPAITDSPKYPAFSSNGSPAPTTSFGARVGGKGSAPGSGRPQSGGRVDVPSSWDLWRGSHEQPIGFGGGFSSWSTSDELRSNSVWSSGLNKEIAPESSRVSVFLVLSDSCHVIHA